MGISTRAKRWLSRLRGRSNKEDEVQQLQPVALAGASRKSCDGRSTLCSSFAATVSTEELQRSYRNKALSDSVLYRPPRGWTQCHSCARNFRTAASKFKDFCSLDCKSLSLYSSVHPSLTSSSFAGVQVLQL